MLKLRREVAIVTYKGWLALVKKNRNTWIYKQGCTRLEYCWKSLYPL